MKRSTRWTENVACIEMRNEFFFFWNSLKENQSEDLDVHGRIILKFILSKIELGWIGLIYLRVGPCDRLL